MNLVLRDPLSITQESFIQTYNAVYVYCSVTSEAYYIEGRAVYELVEKMIREYSKSLCFKASVRDVSDQAVHFRCSVNLLNRIYSYLERFYVRTSIYNDRPVERLQDLFYTQIYFNYVMTVEESLHGLIFLEIETSRSLFRQECGHLKTVVRFYIDILTAANQEEKLGRFYRMYLDNFVGHTNFSAEIGRLLKRVYLEMYFVTNIVGDKGMCRDIVARIDFRRDDIFKHLFSKIEAFENFKHIYKIASMMDDGGHFKKAYSGFVAGRLRALSTFGDLYAMYCRLRRQIISNRMSGHLESLDRHVKEDFVDRNGRNQEEIGEDLVKTFDSLVLGMNGGGAPVCVAGMSAAECGACVNIDTLVGYFALIQNDFIVDLLIESCQLRLLRGASPSIENGIMDKIAEQVGVGAVSKLRNIIMTYLNSHSELFTLEEYGGTGFRVSLLKHTFGYWHFARDSISLPDALECCKNRILGSVRLGYRECISINYNLSPAVFEMNGTRYKINSDLLSLLLHVHRHRDGLLLCDLRKVANDGRFEQNMERLVDCGFCRVAAGDGLVKIVNKVSSEKFIDLFDLKDVFSKDEGVVHGNRQKPAVVEATICRFMKKTKKASIDSLCLEIPSGFAVKNGIEITAPDVRSGIECLAEKGYLHVEDGVVEFVL